MLLVKLFYGLNFAYVIVFPKKIDHDYLYKGKMGHILWRVQKVKQMRKATEYYFTVSVVVLFFNSIQSIIVSIAYEIAYSDFLNDDANCTNPTTGDDTCESSIGNTEFSFRVVVWFITTIVYLYEIYQIKGHLKELDRCVTMRFEEAQ